MSDLHFNRVVLQNVGSGQTLTSTQTFAAYICVQGDGSNAGHVYINAAQGDGGTGFLIEPISTDIGGSAYSLSDPWGRNVFDLHQIFVTADTAGDAVNVLYWTNPRLNDRDLLQQLQWHLLETDNARCLANPRPMDPC